LPLPLLLLLLATRQLYVMGPHCVLTCRSTLTAAALEQAAAAAPAGKQGVVLLPRFSAVALPPPAADTQDSADQHQQQWRTAAGVVVADSSVLGDGEAPPLWALQQLAAAFRSALGGLTLFNMDLIVPQLQPSPTPHAGDGSELQQQEQPPALLVVDVNFLPGYDKVPGAEPLFADFLAAVAGRVQAQLPGPDAT
jgi:hypothetical protein